MRSLSFTFIFQKDMETPLSSSKIKQSNSQNPNPDPTSRSPSPSPLRLWRPAAQRNLRNQWSKLLSLKDRSLSAASKGRSHATSLVNSHLSQRYLLSMDLGALKDMPGVQQKASEKLGKKQEVSCQGLMSSYKDMVAVVSHMVQSSQSMRCFLKVSGASSLVQFCDHPEDDNDLGDGGGTPVFSFFTISNFESLAQELVDMFLLELNLKRLLVVELLRLTYKEASGQATLLSWSHELYSGEFDDLKMIINLRSKEYSQTLPPRLKDWKSGDPPTDESVPAPSLEVLQVYLTTWFVDVNVDMNRIHEIFSVVEDEMQVKLS